METETTDYLNHLDLRPLQEVIMEAKTEAVSEILLKVIQAFVDEGFSAEVFLFGIARAVSNLEGYHDKHRLESLLEQAAIAAGKTFDGDRLHPLPTKVE